MFELQTEKIEMIRLADGAIYIERDSQGRVTVEVKSAERYLRAIIYRMDDVLRLFYFLKPSVVDRIKTLRDMHQGAVEQNREAITHAENHKKKTVFDFEIPNYGKQHLSLEEAKLKLAKQEQELKQIEKELELIQMVGG